MQSRLTGVTLTATVQEHQEVSVGFFGKGRARVGCMPVNTNMNLMPSYLLWRGKVTISSLFSLFGSLVH
jgi:hypothetical protein